MIIIKKGHDVTDVCLEREEKEKGKKKTRREGGAAHFLRICNALTPISKSLLCPTVSSMVKNFNKLELGQNLLETECFYIGTFQPINELS